MRFSHLIERIRERGVAVGELRGGDPEIRGICEDSRKARPGDVFVARAGTKADGTQFIDDALTRGAAAVVLQGDAGLSCAVAYARVADVNLAGALLAHEVAGNPTSGMKMIGITGTKGKTTVAYLLRSVLKAAGHKVGMIGTVEIDDGEKTVPADMTTPGAVEMVEMFSRMKANGVTHCVMEVSSHALHQQRVAGIDFAVAIFTNLTGDHLDYHKTMEEYAAAKAILFEGLREDAVAVVNAHDKWAGRMVEDCRAHILCVEVQGGHEVGGELRYDHWYAGIEEMSDTGSELHIVDPGGCDVHFTSPLVGRHNVYNTLCVIAAAKAKTLGISDRDIYGGLGQMAGVPGRLQRIVQSRESSFQVFVDYAHTHDALENVLTALRATMGVEPSGPAAGGMLLTQGDERVIGGGRNAPQGNDGPSLRQKHGTPWLGRLICLFGCGGDRDRTKRPKMAAVAERLADVVIVTSDNPRTENPAAIIEEICAGFSAGWQDPPPGKAVPRITVEPDRRAAIRKAIAMARPGDVVLLAGKGHENYQIIGTTKHHFDDVEEAEAALREVLKTSTMGDSGDGR